MTNENDPISPPPRNWKTQLRELLNKVRGGLSHSGGGLKSRMEKWGIFDKLPKSFPKHLEPMAVATWVGEAIQRRGLAFYGKLLTVFLCTYFLADITALIAGRFIPEPPPARPPRTGYTSAEKRPPSMEDYQGIFSRNLFNSQGLIPGDDVTIAGGPSDAGNIPVRTSLPFNLVGTLILRDELRSIATIEDKSAQMVYPVRINDEIQAKAKILKIEPRRVTFINTSNGRREYVELPEDLATSNPRVSVGTRPSLTGGKTIQQVSPTQYNIERTEIDKTMADLNNVLTQARCVPSFENGLPVGYKCFQIVPGSIYDKLGLQNGDVVTAINGKSLNDPGKAIEELSNLKDAKHVEITIKRNGRAQTNNYDIR